MDTKSGIKLPKQKYRPVLTAEQINHILYLAKTEVPISESSFSIIATLSPFQAKIDAEAVRPAYDLMPEKLSLFEAIGGVEVTPPSVTYISKEEKWSRAYAKYKLTPQHCTVQEIRDAQEHMYLNDLMSDMELLAFESKMTNGDIPNE